MVVDLRIQYTLRGDSHAGILNSVSPQGCVIEGGVKADIGDVLFLSFEKGVPLGGFKGKVVGQTFRKTGWTMGMYFMDLMEEEKAMLFDRISYFSFLQERPGKKMEGRRALEERRN